MADNGKEAQLKLYNDKFFAAVIGLEVQRHSGIQVLKYIKTNHPSMRFVTTLAEESIIFDSPEEAKKELLM